MMARQWAAVVAIVALWLAFLTMTLAIYVTHPHGAGDYRSYFIGAERLVNGEPLYRYDETYIYPPLLAQVLAPLAAVTDFRTSTLVWFAVNVAALLVTLAAITRYLPSFRWRALLWIVMPIFIPTLQTFWFGQITILLLAATAGAWMAYKAHRFWLTGFLLAVAVWTKFYPGLFIFYFVWKRDWRVVVPAFVSTAGIILFQWLLAGPDNFLSFMVDFLPAFAAQGQPQLNHSNNALLGFVQRLFAQNPQVIPLVDSPALLAISRYGLTALLLGVMLYLISVPRLHMRDTTPRRFDLEYALVLIVALLLGATLGLHGMISLLLVYVILLRNAASERERVQLAGWCALSGALISIHFGIAMGYLLPPSRNTLPALVLSMPFFGMMIALVLIVQHLHRDIGAKGAVRSKSLETALPTTEELA